MEKERYKQCCKILSIAMRARASLYLSGFITETENDKIRQRMRKYQDKYKINESDLKDY